MPETADDISVGTKGLCWRIMKMMKSIKLILLILMSLPILTLAGDDDELPLELMHADKFLTSGKDINNQTNFIGNVHFCYGSTDLRSDRAVWYKKTDLVVFLGSVKVVDSTRTINCETLTYYRNSGSALAVGFVVIEDKGEKAKIEGNRVEYFREEDKFVADGDPKFTLYPDDDSARTEIVGDTIVYSSKDKTGEVIKNVIITRQDMKATCDKAEFLESGSIIKLQEKPQVWQQENLLEGDEITLYTEERDIQNMIVEGNAKATYRDREDTLSTDFTEAVLEGKQLEVFFEGDVITKAVMRRNAISHYLPSASDTLASGQNTASGDSITLFFDGSEIQRVLILGGAQGHYEEQRTNSEGEAYAETTFYDAHEIDYLVKEDMLKLVDEGKLRYQNMSLSSGLVEYNINEELLIARGIYVSTDSGEVLEQTPVLSESGEDLFGKRMIYNIGTRRGKVELGETEMDDKHFFGSELRQVEKDVFYVRSGKVVPCEDKNAGVHFWGHKMKIINKDKMISRPVVMFLGPLPVFAVPYIVFPIRKGRHSGIMQFTLGNFERGERFIRDVGYYWAASEYWDAQASMDYYENSRTTLNGSMRYNKRYMLDGSVGMSYSRHSDWSNYERTVRNDWRINFSHNQILSETMRLTGSGSFLSSKSYNIDNSYDEDERVNREINSKMSFTKSWQNDYLRSLRIAVSQNWNLDSDNRTRSLPEITFTSASIQLFKPKEKDKSIRVLPWDEVEEEDDTKWYQLIKFNITSSFKNDQRYYETRGVQDWKKFKTLYSRMSLSFNPKLFGILTLSPSMSLQQTLYKIDEVHDGDSASYRQYVPVNEDDDLSIPGDIAGDDTSIVYLNTGKIYSREVLAASIGASTNLYGTFYPNIFGITGFRHVMTPSASYSFAPETRKNDIYQKYTGVGGSSRRQRSFSFGLNNTFQMKMGSGDEVKKIDLLNINFSSGYDIEADAEKLKPLSTSVTSKAVPIIDVSARFTHRFYDENGARHIFSPSLATLALTASFNRTIVFSGGEQPGGDPSSWAEFDEKSSNQNMGGNRSYGSDETSLTVSLDHRYTESRLYGETTSKSRYLNCDFDLKLTKGWKIETSFKYDLENKKTGFPVFSLGRDLNCWAGTFEWRPTGSLAGYYFKIYIKQLPDIKVEQSTGGFVGGSGSYFNSQF